MKNFKKLIASVLAVTMIVGAAITTTSCSKEKEKKSKRDKKTSETEEVDETKETKETKKPEETSAPNSDSSIDEKEAVVGVNSIMDSICANDLESMYEVFGKDDYDNFDEYKEAIVSNPGADLIFACIKEITYETEVTENGDDYLIVTSYAKMPDLAVVVDKTLTEDFMVEMLAEYIAYGPEQSKDAASLIFEKSLVTLPTVTETSDLEFVFKVTEGSDGLAYESVSVTNPMEGVDVDLSRFDENQEEITMKAIDYAFDNGMIDEATYEELMKQFDVYYPDSNDIVVTEGSDFKDIKFYNDSEFQNEVSSYSANDEGVYIWFQFQSVYTSDSTFYTDVYVDGKLTVDHLAATMRDPVGTNWGDLSLHGPLQAGHIKIVITGFNGEIFATIEFDIK